VEQRAAMVVEAMTLDEKIRLLPQASTRYSNGRHQHYQSRNYSLQRRRLRCGNPAAGHSRDPDAGRCLWRPDEWRKRRYSTALPADIGAAATWDPEAAYDYGALIGRELRAQGYNTSLGGVNLRREPRNGRIFEYLGEDPVLAGKMVGSVLQGLQARHVLAISSTTLSTTRRMGVRRQMSTSICVPLERAIFSHLRSGFRSRTLRL
jgi:beta-glucosidase